MESERGFNGGNLPFPGIKPFYFDEAVLRRKRHDCIAGNLGRGLPGIGLGALFGNPKSGDVG